MHAAQVKQQQLRREGDDGLSKARHVRQSRVKTVQEGRLATAPGWGWNQGMHVGT